MRVSAYAVAGVAVLAVFVAAVPSGAGGPRPRRIAPLRARPVWQQIARRPQTNVASPTPCTEPFGTNGQYSFIAITNGGDVAGGDDTAVLAGNSNEACDEFAGIGAGLFNTVGGGGNATYSFVSGGEYNGITGSQSFIGGGAHGLVSGSGSFIGAGDYFYSTGSNMEPANQVAGSDSFLGAGDTNVVNANEAFLGSGQSNTIVSTADYASIVGGVKNVASGSYSAVLAGYANTASGEYATVLGGNTATAAGELSLAAGYHADAVHTGSFVWSDFSSGSAIVKDNAANQFVARSSGGVTFYTNEALTSGVRLAAGSGTWSSLSDRNAKSHIATLDDDAVLAKVAALPLSTWQYASEAGVRHAGPMAQDFYAAFGIGEDDRHITSIDEDGITLAAIKGLNGKLARKSDEIAALRGTVSMEHAEIATLQREMRTIEARLGARR